MIQAKVRCPKCNHPFTVRRAGNVEMTPAQKEAADQVLKEAKQVLNRASKGIDGLGDRLTRAFDAFIGRK